MKLHIGCCKLSSKKESPADVIGFMIPLGSPRRHTWRMCFFGGYSSPVAPQRCRLRLPPKLSWYVNVSDYGCKGTAFI